MKYFNNDQCEKMVCGAKENLKLDIVLQKYFPSNREWGANVFFDENGDIGFIEICKLTDVTLNSETWSHYATIGVYKSSNGDKERFWELYSQFNGKKEDELWILGYYKNFGDAVRRVFKGIENLKPIKIY